MEKKLENLIINLHTIVNDTTLNIRHDGHYHINQPIIATTISLANDCLIANDKQVIQSNIDIVAEYGFSIYVGDMDNYGWLTGIIDLPHGVIMFG
jgi:hypothetical protein